MILFSKLKNTNQDYEKFLVQLYQKRMKANHTKFSEYLHNIYYYYLDDIYFISEMFHKPLNYFPLNEVLIFDMPGHCANEMARMSKSSTELGVVKDSGSMR